MTCINSPSVNIHYSCILSFFMILGSAGKYFFTGLWFPRNKHFLQRDFLLWIMMKSPGEDCRKKVLFSGTRGLILNLSILFYFRAKNLPETRKSFVLKCILKAKWGKSWSIQIFVEMTFEVLKNIAWLILWFHGTVYMITSLHSLPCKLYEYLWL